MGAAAYIKDFVDSKDPRFEGKTKKERMKQALAAYYAAKNESVEIEDDDTLEEGRGSEKVYHLIVNGRYVATTKMAKNSKEAIRNFVKAYPEHKDKRITTTEDQ